MNAAPSLKQPKVEIEEEPSGGEAPMAAANDNGNGGAELYREEQEEALVALIEHRTNEVEHLRRRITYYKSQLEEAERRLDETQLKLARLRGQDSVKSAKSYVQNGMEETEVREKMTNRAQISEGSSQNQSQTRIQPRVEDGKPSNSTILKNVKLEPQSRSQLVIPAATPKISQPTKMSESCSKSMSGSGASRSNTLANARVDSSVKLKGDKPSRSSSEHGAAEIQAKGIKRKFEQNEHKELIPLVRSCSTPCTIRCHTGCLISSQHKRKLRSLALCPTNDNLFVTSALDGVVNLWQIQGKGSMANLLSTTDCASQKQRRWPEDIAWHPQGNSLLAVYAADGGDSQISVMNLNKTKERTRVTFLEDKPHFKGIINNIVFMPWEETCFVTGGSDHAVILWTEKEGEYSWKQKSLHRSMHSSAVMGVAGMQQKHMVISVGADKRIIGFDVLAGRAEYKHQIESKCMSVLPNPCDFNLFMVQTGTPERQLRLFDIRLRQTELHTFGWKQESSESQSALINQAWSPDGLFITSGSADPMIHIFDIRFNAHKPSQSISAHQKRVFKAVWHHAYPLMVSISSDLNIGLHKIV